MLERINIVNRQELLFRIAAFAGGLFIYAAIFVLSYYLRPLIPSGQFVASVLGVLLTAHFCGTGPAIVVTVLSSILTPLFFIEPFGVWKISNGLLLREALFFLVAGITMRITGRKRDAIRALQRAMKARDLIGRAAGEVVWERDLRTGEVHWNEAAESMFGILRHTSGNDLRSWTDGIHPGDTERVLNGVKRAIESGGDAWTDQYRFRRKDGTYAVVLDRGYVIRDGNGTPRQMVGSMLDLSERLLAQQRLVENEERLRTALDAGHCGVWDWDVRTGQFNWTDRMFQLHGLASGNFIGTFDEFLTLVHPEDGPRVSSAIDDAVKQHSPYAVEFRVGLPDGEVRWIQANGRVIYDPDGRPIRMVGASLEIDDRKLNEQRKDYVANLSQVLSGSLDAEEIIRRLADLSLPTVADWALVHLCDANGVVYRSQSSHVSPIKAAILKRALEDYAVNPQNDFGTSEVVRTGKTVVVNDSAASTASVPVDPDPLKTIHTRSFVTMPLKSRSGVIGALTFGISESTRRFTDDDLAFIEDVARRAALAVDNALLYQRAQNQADELLQSNEELEQFAYVASHDLQEPLRKISNYSELLAGKAKGRLEPDAERFLDAIVSSARRMHDLIQDLLSYSRVTRSDRKKEHVDVTKVAEQVLSDLETRIQEKGARVLIEPGLPTVLAGPTEIRQVLQNLISNALKFNSSVSPQVRVFPVEREGHTVIGVEDNGIGIESAYRENIFKVFQRLHTHEKFPGTGIGLAICKKIVESHGGKIWVESKPGDGSTFFFYLPTVAAAPIQSPQLPV